MLQVERFFHFHRHLKEQATPVKMSPRTVLSLIPPPSFSDGDSSTHPSPVTGVNASTLRNFLKKCGPTLKAIYEANPSKCPLTARNGADRKVVFSADAALESLPRGYVMITIPRQNTTTPKAGDSYVWGHPSGIKFRSVSEFLPHLTWLATSETHQASECECKPCMSWIRGSTPRVRKRTSETPGESSIGGSKKPRLSHLGNNTSPIVVSDTESEAGPVPSDRVPAAGSALAVAFAQRMAKEAKGVKKSPTKQRTQSALPSESKLARPISQSVGFNQPMKHSRTLIDPIQVEGPKQRPNASTRTETLSPDLDDPLDSASLSSSPVLLTKAAKIMERTPAIHRASLTERIPRNVYDKMKTQHREELKNFVPSFRTEPYYRFGDIVWIQTYLQLSSREPNVRIHSGDEAVDMDISCLQDTLSYWPAVINSVYTTTGTSAKDSREPLRRFWATPIFVHEDDTDDETHQVGDGPKLNAGLQMIATHHYPNPRSLIKWDGRGYSVRLLNTTKQFTVLESQIVPFSGYILPRQFRLDYDLLDKLAQPNNKILNDPVLAIYLTAANKAYHHARSTLAMLSPAPRFMPNFPGSLPDHLTWDYMQLGAEHVRVYDLVRVHIPHLATDARSEAESKSGEKTNTAPPAPTPAINFRVARVERINFTPDTHPPVITFIVRVLRPVRARLPNDANHPTLCRSKSGDWVIYVVDAAAKALAAEVKSAINGGEAHRNASPATAPTTEKGVFTVEVPHIVGRYYPVMGGRDGWVGPRKLPGLDVGRAEVELV
ncbi:uncharacterized protein EV422DRAFT_530411 [Fimicolochytrium jonesii]|uniref:uncharacterized protein n=1 Tax=Fimicolochytrium jonesii TaxID=1396493 RepID=UPI0022FDBD05|nr:uncharacterized protein EV422DRAFT_530411 [Fimicolochytrium jonesii]KAI8820840.1 hypothetical protein EV422DRAFT_530411 [Fimicolochytrium jonesii]